MIPSSARSTASEAKPLPTQLVPLLGEPLEQAKVALDKAFPKSSTRSVLEEAEYEDEAEGGLEREMMLQAMESLRVHRPRIAICGAQGMGQTYIGAAALHHLEGIQVQSLDLGTLMGDSTRVNTCPRVWLEPLLMHQPFRLSSRQSFNCSLRQKGTSLQSFIFRPC